MKLIGIIYLVSFCCHLDVAPTNVASELNKLLKKFSWNWLSNEKFNSDDLHTPEMIKIAGYPAETHVVMTDDGYLLTLHRIPGSKGSPPVLLQHGLLSSSADWLVLGKGKALAYLLADQGYDVWLGNFRGNLYSRAHISLSTSNSTFWDFSFNEMGIYDLPAIITFITNMRSQSLHAYIGHSMGTTSFYIMASERPEIVGMVKLMISLAPTAFMESMKSPLRYLDSFYKVIQMIMNVLFHGEFLNRYLSKLFAKSCIQNYYTQTFCINVIFLINGYNFEQFNYTMLPLIMNHIPAGSSFKSWMHYIQGRRSKKFRRYDYGRAKNLLMYHSAEPPEYDLSNVTVPIFMIYGNNDWLVDPADVKKLFHLLPNVIDIYEVPLSKFNHVDFLWAKDAPKLLYERILTIIREENPIN